MDNYWREGVHALSLNEVCRRARISKPALYREFGNEDGLMTAVLDRYREEVLQPLLDALVLEVPFPDLVGHLVTEMTSERPGPLGCLFTKMRVARSHLGPETQARLVAVEAERLAALAAWFRRALGSGEVDDSVSPGLAARFIDSQLTLLLLQMGAGEPPEDIREQARLAFRVLEARRRSTQLA